MTGLNQVGQRRLSLRGFGIMIVMQPTSPSPSSDITPPKPPQPKPEPKPASPAASQLVKPSKLQWFKDHKWWVIGVGFGLLLAAAAAAYLILKKPKPAAPKPVAKKSEAKAPEPILAPLTGLPTTADIAAQPVFGVVIENSPDARPQSSLSQAGVVYETVAEGGITRFLAVYQDQQPTNIGPVRSLRPYFISWIQEYNNAPVAHAGGSYEALAGVHTYGVKSMNGLNYGAYFRRAGDRYAPHNLYTSYDKLAALMTKQHYTTKPDFAQWTRKKDNPLAQPTYPTISIRYSSPLFTAKYTFDTGCDCYNRLIASVPSIERNTNKQIQVKNVVVIATQATYDTKGHALLTTEGSGKAYIFTDGGLTEGIWKKGSKQGRMTFVTADGTPIALNAGNTWIGAIPPTGGFGR